MLTLFRKICFDRKNSQSLVPTVKTAETPVKTRVSRVLEGAEERSKCSKRHPFPRTRNQFGSNPTWVRIPPAAPARRKRHIACDEFFHFIAKLIARSFCCSSLPNRTRLRWAPVWVRRCAAAFSYRKEISILTVPSKNPECESVRDFYLFPLHDSFFLIPSLSTGFLEERGK